MYTYIYIFIYIYTLIYVCVFIYSQIQTKSSPRRHWGKSQWFAARYTMRTPLPSSLYTRCRLQFVLQFVLQCVLQRVAVCCDGIHDMDTSSELALRTFNVAVCCSACCSAWCSACCSACCGACCSVRCSVCCRVLWRDTRWHVSHRKRVDTCRI